MKLKIFFGPSHLRAHTENNLLALAVKPVTNAKHLRKACRWAAVVLMLSLWVALCALQVSPEFHNFLHKDARSPSHNCLVTQLQHHSVHSGCASTLLPAALANWSPLQALCDFLLPAAIEHRLSPSRAPPVV